MHLPVDQQGVCDVGKKGADCADEERLPDADDAAAGRDAHEGAEHAVDRGQDLDLARLHMENFTFKINDTRSFV